MMITEASGADISRIQAIAARTWPAAYGAILPPDQIRYMLELFYSSAALEQQLQDGHRFLLLSEGDTALGFAGYEPDYAPQTTKLHKLYVLPEAQGAGAGRRLMEAVKSAARRCGQERLVLNVNRHNKAREFYERAGWSILREADIAIGQGYFMNDYIMGCDL